MGQIANLVIGITANAAGFQAGLDKARGHLKGFQSEMSLSGPSASLGGIASVGGPMAAAVLGVNALIGTMKDAADEFEKTKNAADSFGMSVNQMKTFEILGDSLKDDLVAGLNMMQKKLTEAAGGSADARQDFDKLGLSWQDLGKMDIDKAFAEIVKKTESAGTQAQKAAIAYGVFGKSAKGVMPILNKGMGGLNEANRMSDALAISPADEARLEKVDTMFDGMALAWKKIKQEVATAPGGLSDWMKGLMNPKMLAKEQEAAAASRAQKDQNKLKGEFLAAAEEAAEAEKKIRDGIEDNRIKALDKELDDANNMNNSLLDQAAALGKVGREADLAKLALHGMNEQWKEQLSRKGALLDVADQFETMRKSLQDFGKTASEMKMEKLTERAGHFGNFLQDPMGAIGQMALGARAMGLQDQLQMNADAKFPGMPTALKAGSSQAISFQNKLEAQQRFDEGKRADQEELKKQAKEVVDELKEMNENIKKLVMPAPANIGN